MNKIKTHIKLFSAVAAVSLALIASPVQAKSVDGYYISAKGGVNWMTDQTVNTGNAGVYDTDFDAGYTLTAALGYDYTSNWRGEIEASILDNDVESHASGNTEDAGSDGSVTTIAIMANAIYDFENSSDFVPYIGAGIGFARVEFKDYSSADSGDILDDEANAFAYQAFAGMAYEFHEDWALTLDYKYFATDKPDVKTTLGSNDTDIDNENHSVNFGLRYTF